MRAIQGSEQLLMVFSYGPYNNYTITLCYPPHQKTNTIFPFFGGGGGWFLYKGIENQKQCKTLPLGYPATQVHGSFSLELGGGAGGVDIVCFRV